MRGVVVAAVGLPLAEEAARHARSFEWTSYLLPLRGGHAAGACRPRRGLLSTVEARLRVAPSPCITGKVCGLGAEAMFRGGGDLVEADVFVVTPCPTRSPWPLASTPSRAGCWTHRRGVTASSPLELGQTIPAPSLAPDRRRGLFRRRLARHPRRSATGRHHARSPVARSPPDRVSHGEQERRTSRSDLAG